MARREQDGAVTGNLAGDGAVFACRVYCYTAVCLAAWVVVGLLIGLRPVAITSGSMQPAIATGDIVMYDPDSATWPSDPGWVATYHDPRDNARLVTHRVVETADNGLRTKGDANSATDAWTVPVATVEGVGRLLVPAAGLPMAWWLNGQLPLFGAWLIGTMLTLAVAGRTVGTPMDRRSWTVIAALFRRQPVVFRWSSGVAAMLALVSLITLLPATSAAAFTSNTRNRVNSWDALALIPPQDVTTVYSCGLIGIGDAVDVSWQPSAQATGHDVFRSLTSGGGYTLIGQVGGTTGTFRDENVEASTTYYYVVEATLGSWRSGLSAEASITTPSVCL